MRSYLIWSLLSTLALVATQCTQNYHHHRAKRANQLPGANRSPHPVTDPLRRARDLAQAHQFVVNEAELTTMLHKSKQHTAQLIYPRNPIRFRTSTSQYRLHCRVMTNWIAPHDIAWVLRYRLATNLIAYYMTEGEADDPDSLDDHIDFVCYLVNAVDQREADCLLRMVQDDAKQWFAQIEFADMSRLGQVPQLTGKYCKYRNYWFLVLVALVVLVFLVIAGLYWYRHRRDDQRFVPHRLQNQDQFYSL